MPNGDAAFVRNADREPQKITLSAFFEKRGTRFVHIKMWSKGISKMNNTSNKKRFFSILTVLLSVIVMFSVLGTVIFAEETGEVTDTTAVLDGTENDEIVIEEEDTGFKLNDILLIPMGFIIRVCYNVSNNYMTALLLFAIVMQIILFPLGIKQQKNSNKQASLRPKENAIRKKYAGRNDAATQQKVQQEIMNLYQQENFNPASGCLPLLIQLPIIFALFAVVRQPLTYVTRLSAGVINSLKEQIANLGYTLNAGYEEISIITYLKDHGMEGIKGISLTAADIEAMPNFKMFGGMFDISVTPSTQIWSIYILVPILTFIVLMLSQYLTKKFSYRPETAAGSADPSAQTSMKVMNWMMPLMSVYFAFIVPSAIGVYWIFRNILSVIQQIILSLLYPTPKFTEEELLASEKEYLGKTKNKPKAERDPNRPRPRSLHTIDFDDDDTAEAPKAPVKSETKENSALAPAPLKEDKSDK